ncbi:hypothetical protein D4A92_09030 [Rhizobium rosettiformans]|uniref:Uncharacterized protein n=1 Tax=Rhizobium rosettiformans TaxID=1368430 RepID=A0ABX7ETI0_9HYPH|nr:hypothetical protein D4A92_09030 [Rhizobium rosettiformans]
MTRVGGIIWNRFSGFPQLASRVSQVCNRWNLVAHASGARRPNPRLLLRFLWNSLTLQGEMPIVPAPPRGGIFNFLRPREAAPSRVTDCREGS